MKCCCGEKVATVFGQLTNFHNKCISAALDLGHCEQPSQKCGTNEARFMHSHEPKKRNPKDSEMK